MAEQKNDLFYFTFRNYEIEENPMKPEVPLKPCPFCGGKPFLTGMYPTGQFYVRCDDCRASLWYDRQDKAIGMWNQRFNPAQ